MISGSMAFIKSVMVMLFFSLILPFVDSVFLQVLFLIHPFYPSMHAKRDRNNVLSLF